MAYPKRHFTEEARREAKRLANVRYRARLAALRSPPPTRDERFWSYVDRSGDCWLWKKTLNQHGYGVFGWPVNGKPRMQLAHRLAWTLTKGAPTQNVLHRCDNPPCVNPAHLFLGTQRENMEDAARKGRVAKVKTRLPNIPKRQGNYARRVGERAPFRKLTWAQVAEIRSRYLAGENQMALGHAYGVTNGAVWYIVHNKTWIV